MAKITTFILASRIGRIYTLEFIWGGECVAIRKITGAESTRNELRKAGLVRNFRKWPLKIDKFKTRIEIDEPKVWYWKDDIEIWNKQKGET